MYKKIIALVLALFQLSACAFLFASCQPAPVETPIPTETGTPTPTPTETPSETPTATPTPAEKTEAEIIEEELSLYNYCIGTQAFKPNYQFTNKSAMLEISECIVDMGSNMIKFHAETDTAVDKIIQAQPELKYIFMWYRSNPYWKDADGYTETDKANDYTAIKNYVKRLLRKFNGSGITFYIGHWEGDWYYLDNYNTQQKTVSNKYTEGMIEWINNRQKAVDDAKREVEYENVEVWNYIEINRPMDAMLNDYDRVVNRVLPYTNVDYVSYSAYDCMYESAETVQKVIDYIYTNLPEKEGVDGPRVFIGEFGQPAANCSFNDEEHARQNLAMFAKFLNTNVKFVLYWQMYDNEKLADGSCRGFWLINDKNEKTALYDALEELLSDGRRYVRKYRTENGVLPSEEEYKEFLLRSDYFQ